MKYIIVMLLIPFLLASECGNHKAKALATKENKETVKDSVPPCIRKLIDESNKESTPNAPLQIDEYVYNNRDVFLLTSECCDQFNMLYDDSCKALCAPTGGFTGGGDGKCGDFTKTAKHLKLIWRKTMK